LCNVYFISCVLYIVSHAYTVHFKITIVLYFINPASWLPQ